MGKFKRDHGKQCYCRLLLVLAPLAVCIKLSTKTKHEHLEHLTIHSNLTELVFVESNNKAYISAFFFIQKARKNFLVTVLVFYKSTLYCQSYLYKAGGKKVLICNNLGEGNPT